DNPIVVYIDNDFVDLYHIDDPAELHTALRDKGIDYVALPAYGQSEVSRSAFKALLNDGRYATLVFQDSGERLFRILEAPVPLIRVETTRDEPSPVGVELDVDGSETAMSAGEAISQLSDPEVSSAVTLPDGVETRVASASDAADVRGRALAHLRDADLPHSLNDTDWTGFLRPLSFAETLRYGQPDVSLVDEPGGAAIRIERERPFIANPAIVDVLQDWPLQFEHSPIVRSQTEFPVENGLYNIRGIVEADGKVDLYLRVSVLGADQRMRTYQWPIWSEVLNAEETEIIVKTAIAIPELEHLRRNLNATESAMLYFTLEQGGYLELKSLSIDRIAEIEGQSGFFDLVRSRGQANVNGWTLQRRQSVLGYDRPLDLLQGNGHGGVTFQQISDLPEAVISTPYAILESQRGVLDDLKLERRGQQFAPKLNMRVNSSGHGALSVSVIGNCSDGSEFNVDMREYSLTPDMLTLTPSRELPCVPSLVRAVFSLDRDRFLYPPNFEHGHSDLSDLSMNIVLWTDEGIQQTLRLQAAPELAEFYVDGDSISDQIVQPSLAIPNFDR
ncbi:MAG: hypothetical protein AAF926_06750, partial [Pseudomonadota bacterium]